MKTNHRYTWYDFKRHMEADHRLTCEARDAMNRLDDLEAHDGENRFIEDLRVCVGERLKLERDYLSHEDDMRFRSLGKIQRPVSPKLRERDALGRFINAANTAPTANTMLNGREVDVAEIVDSSWPHNKVAAIKKLRELTGLGLKESKDAIDAEYARRSNGNGADEIEEEAPTRSGSRLERMRHKPHFVRPE